MYDFSISNSHKIHLVTSSPQPPTEILKGAEHTNARFANFSIVGGNRYGAPQTRFNTNSTNSSAKHEAKLPSIRRCYSYIYEMKFGLDILTWSSASLRECFMCHYSVRSDHNSVTRGDHDLYANIIKRFEYLPGHYLDRN